MEPLSLNSEEKELQQMQLDEREPHQKCLARFKNLKSHLETLYDSSHYMKTRSFEIAFRIFFLEKYDTFKDKMYHNMIQLQRSFVLRYLEELDKLIDERVLKCGELRIKEKEVQAIKEIERRLQEIMEACLVNGGITVNDIMGATESSETVSENSSSETLVSISEDENRSFDKDCSNSRNECSRLGNENRSSDKESSSSEGNDANANIGFSYDSDTVSVVPHDMLENVFAHGIQCHEQPESILDTYESAVFASLISNLKCDVEKCNKVNHEAQQANVSLTNELERYKKKEKHFANDMTIESEYFKKIKLLNDEISNLKSQACEKDKTLAKENEKYDEYVQPLLKRKNELEKKNQEFLKQINNLNNRLRKARQTDQTLRMLLPKEDNVNMGKRGLGFENHNDDVNPSLLNKAKELAPYLYNIDEIGKHELSDHKIISEELKCKAEKRLKVKQRKSPLSYHGFIYAETQFEEPPKVSLKRRNVNLKNHLEQIQNFKDHLEQAQLRDHDTNLWNSLPMKYFCYVKQALIEFEKQTFLKQELNQNELFRMGFEQEYEHNINTRVRSRLSDEFKPLVKNINLQINCFEKSLVKEMKGDLKYVMSLEDEFDESMFEQNSALENENCSLKMTISQLQNDFSKMKEKSIAFDIALQHKIQENTSLKTMQTENENFVASLQIKNAHLKKTYKDLFESIQTSRDESNQCNDVKLKFDFDEIETQNIKLKHKVASLIKENEHLKLIYKNLFDSIKKSRIQTQSSNVSQNKAENLKSQLSEFADKIFDKVFQKIESMKKKFDTQNSNDFLQKSVYDSDFSNVKSELGEKNIIFRNETSSFETKIKDLKMTLAQQTKDFEDAKDDFSKKTNNFETYFEKLEKKRVVLERQLDRKIQDSKAAKDQFLKQIASLESKLASHDLLSNQKEYSELRTSYNALKAKFDSLNRDKGKSQISNSSKVSVSPKIYTGESSKSFPKRVSQFTSHSLQKDRKFYKKHHVYETSTSQKFFKSSDSSKKNKFFKTLNSRFTPVKQVWRPKQSHSKPFKYSKSEMLSLHVTTVV
ncbi:hypothetical protein Tco_1473750 [Tanacetum coccineum]